MTDVILIGGDHHNGLGLVRSFGLHNVKPHGIIIDKHADKGFLRYSKYWGKVWFAKDEKDALEILRKENFSQKPILIPYSDGAAKMIDLNLNELSERYLCPSICGKQGEITRLMDKLEQTKLAQQFGLKMLTSQIIEIEKPDISLHLPLIVKPVISAEGRKIDIRICITQEELISALQFYKENNYSHALLQTYLSNYSEYVLTGAVFDHTVSFTIAQRIRQWPLGTGSGSFSTFCIDTEVVQYARNVLQAVLNIGYQGPIDIEFFQDAKGQFYLNEINWRSSGRNFVSLYNGVHSAYFYYCALLNNPLPVDEPLINDKEGFSMDEATDLRHVMFGGLSLCQWNRDRHHTHSFALWYRKDLKPTFARYMELICKRIRGKKKA